MKRNYLKLFVSTLLLGLTHGIGYAAPLASGSSESVVVKFAAKNGAAARGATSTMPDKLVFDGTGATATVFVEAIGLE